MLFIIPDGVSLRNFVYTSFYQEAKSKGIEVVFLNLTIFSLKRLGLKEVVPDYKKQHLLTDSFKNAKKRVELNQFIRQFNDHVYHKYWFSLPYSSFSSLIKSSISNVLIATLNSKKGLTRLRNKIRKLEQHTAYYKSCKQIINEIQPDLVYCASQRATLAIAPIEAAKELKLPTIGFVYSWDNLPKSMLDVETDYYHVWSDHMKQELQKYYPFIKEHQITVTGTPQFEPHFDSSGIVTKEDFYFQHELDRTTDYICFSGDDITTSPQDPMYLRDVAAAIRKMNENGYKLSIIFRRCPVDFSDRFDEVLKAYQDVIVPIVPLWESVGEAWNTKLPTKEDTVLLANIAAHCKAVINLGSSMVFDFAIHNKPCGYMNYHYNAELQVEKGVHVYDYVHFRSMPQKECVVWLEHPETIEYRLNELLETPEVTADAARMWFNTINLNAGNKASTRILEHIQTFKKL